MPIAPGTRFGPYEVLSLLGAGGMGEVYRARDGRLNRDVAIKILPGSVARDEASRARFEREAQAIAALSHPNVLAIFDTGAQDEHLFVVTELLEGETLRERLRHGRLPVHKAIEYAAAVAHGLAATHDKQVVHRDLKPDNIFLTTDGRVKILDFGLAKTAATAAPGSAVETAAAITGEGTVLGTVGYMAPEQVRGQAVDARTDVFALGTVLYEMLTGRRAFHRDTAADTLSAILREEPAPLADTGVTLPPGLDRLIRHCLEKNPKERFQTAHDAAFALETLSSASATPGVSSPSATNTRPFRRARPVALMGVAVAMIAAVVWAVAHYSSSQTPDARAIAVGASTQITAEDGLEIDAALSPDGKLLAYSAGQARQMRIFIRPVAGGRILTLSEGATGFEYQPRWSPDGSQILFLRPDGVFVASSLGGSAKTVATGNFSSAAWSPDGTRVLLARPDRLSVIAVTGGAEQELTKGGVDLHSCVWSPSNVWIACASGNSQSNLPGRRFANVAPSGVVLAPVVGGPFVTLSERSGVNLSPAWSPDGRLLYFISNREGPRDIFVVDIGATGSVGVPRRVTTGLNVQSIAFAASFDRLAYVTSTMRANVWSMPIPASGPVDIAGAQALTSSNQVVESVKVSLDHKWLLFDSTLHLNAEILRMPIGGGAVERLTTDPAEDFAPDLSPDGRTLAYQSWRNGTRDIYIQSVDGSKPQALTDTQGQESYPRWSPDGQKIAFVEQKGFALDVVHGVLFVMERKPDGQWSEPRAVFNGTATQGMWIRRPEGLRLAYTSMGGVMLINPETRKFSAIYVPGSAGDPIAWSVAVSEDERTLYFKSADADGRTTFWSLSPEGGRPHLLVRLPDLNRQSIRPDFAVGDGRLFFTIEDRQADIWIANVSRK